MTIYTCACCITLATGKCRLQRSILLFSITYPLIWFFLPDFGEVMLWKTGSIVYLWTTTFALTWLIPYRLLLIEKNNTNWGPYTTAAFTLFSSMVGNGMEHTSFCVLLMAGAAVILCMHQKISVPSWAWWGLGGLLVGWILLMVAPGNFERASNLESLSITSLLQNIEKIARYAITPFIIFPLIYILSRLHAAKFNFRHLPSPILIAVFFIFFGLLNLGALVFSPYIPNRAFSPSFFIILCGIIALLNYCIDDTTQTLVPYSDTRIQINKYIFAYALSSIVIFFAISTTRTVRIFLIERSNYIEMMRSLNEFKNSGEQNIVLQEYPAKVNPKNYHIGQRLSEDPNHWINICFAKCNGINSVKIVKTDIPHQEKTQ